MSARIAQGESIIYLQRTLSLGTEHLKIDGVLGPRTEAALKSFQLGHGIAVTGAMCRITAAMLGREAEIYHLLTRDELRRAADSLGVKPASLYALMQVETDGAGFLPDGRPKILFERHVMYRRMIAANLDADAARQAWPELVNTLPGGYEGGAAEHARLERAQALSVVAALESCSWGLFQIMGFHWQALGFDSVEDFVRAMHESEWWHLNAFIRFVIHDEATHAALREGDWSTFARRYNGAGFRRNAYDDRLGEAYAHYKMLLDADSTGM
jgi:hypothetical protein